jgi:hypothetical protein
MVPLVCESARFPGSDIPASKIDGGIDEARFTAVVEDRMSDISTMCRRQYLSGRKGRAQSRTGPDELSGRAAARDLRASQPFQIQRDTDKIAIAPDQMARSNRAKVVE